MENTDIVIIERSIRRKFTNETDINKVKNFLIYLSKNKIISFGKMYNIFKSYNRYDEDSCMIVIDKEKIAEEMKYYFIDYISNNKKDISLVENINKSIDFFVNNFFEDVYDFNSYMKAIGIFGVVDRYIAYNPEEIAKAA